MDIEVVALCDAATEQAGKLNILGAFDSIQSPQFPFVHPQCAFVCRIRFNRIEQGEHSFKLDFVDQDGKSLVPPLEAKINLNFPKGADSQVSNMILNMQGLKFAKPGKYLFELAINNRQEASLPLHIKKIDLPKRAQRPQQAEDNSLFGDDPEIPGHPESPDDLS
ncbi:MAG: hypothetical protein OCD01_11005 [Fibrobacterales bacterium]